MGLVWFPLGFAVFGLLISRQAVLGAGAGALFGLLVLVVAAVALLLGHAAVRAQGGLLRRSLSDGALVLLPFAVVALVAELGLHWNAGQIVASSGLMASVGACSAAAGKHGGRSGVFGSLLTLLASGALLLAWMGLGTVLSKVGSAP